MILLFFKNAPSLSKFLRVLDQPPSELDIMINYLPLRKPLTGLIADQAVILLDLNYKNLEEEFPETAENLLLRMYPGAPIYTIDTTESEEIIKQRIEIIKDNATTNNRK